MIKFAAYLDVNQAALKKCESNIARLESDNAEKRRQIEKQKIKLEVYRQQTQAIKRETEAISVYQDYLQKVKNENPDEYTELKDILSRYKVLIKSQSELKAKQLELSRQLDSKTSSVAKTEDELNNLIMNLNTEMFDLQRKMEVIMSKKQQLKSKEEEVYKKIYDRQTELSRILMSVENLEAMCTKRAKDAGLVINYSASQFTDKADFKAGFALDSNRKELAVAQLAVVNQYLVDFQAIIKSVSEQKEAKKASDASAAAKEEESK